MSASRCYVKEGLATSTAGSAKLMDMNPGHRSRRSVTEGYTQRVLTMRELSREIRFESLDALDRSAVSRSESQQNLKVCGEGKAGDLTDLTGCFSFVSDVSVRLADCLSSERNASRGSLEEDYKKSLSDKDTTIRAVETLIQYRFRNAALLWEALQVPGSGTVGAGKTKPADGNKRLAIVGDAALRLALAEDWYPGGTPKGKVMLCWVMRS